MKIYGPALRVGGLLLASAALLPCWVGAQTPKTAAATAAPAKSVSQVEVARAGQQTTVRVNTRGGSGELTYHSRAPQQSAARGAGFGRRAPGCGRNSGRQQLRTGARGAAEPVPADQVRVVIDLLRPTGFYVEQQGQDLTVTFLDDRDRDGSASAVPAPQRCGVADD